MLRGREVVDRWRRLVEALLASVGDDADDGAPLAAPLAVEPDALAEHVLPRKVAPHPGLVHQRDRRRLRVVGAGELAAGHHALPQGREISGHRPADLAARLHFAGAGLISLDEVAEPIVPAGGEQVDPAGGLDAGD